MAKSRSTTEPSARDPMDVSVSALKKFKSSGIRAPDGPTPERLLKAGGGARVERFATTAEIYKDGQSRPEAVAVEMIRMRIEDSPFERICRRRQLAPKDVSLNLILARAGVQYRQAFSATGLEGIKCVDFGRVGHGGSGGLLTTEAQCQAFQVYSAASKTLSPICKTVVGAIVLDERTAEDVGREVGAYTHPAMATAVGMFVLRIGLAALAKHFGLLGDAADAVPAEIVMSEGHAAECGL